MEVLLFSPIGIKNKDYKASYPELGRYSEFEDFRGSELAFVWWYANATSPIIELEREKRVGEALKRSGYNPEPAEYERLLQLQFTERLEVAIERMASFIPGARYFAMKSLKNIFDQYQEIASKKASDFKKKVGSGESATEETDYKAYSDVTGAVIKQMPALIQRLEEGFGITTDGASEDEEEGHSLLREWHLQKLDD